MSYDELQLDLMGDRKSALFVIISDTDDTFNFVASIMYTQLFNLLCDRADDHFGGRLPVHVRCLLDEFANIGQIPKFDKLIATIRSREISASIILQSQSQLKAIYKDSADTILGNCDTTLFLGGKETTTLKEMSEMLGKETIDLFNTSDTRGTNRSYGINYQKTGKDLMSKDELAVMDGSMCMSLYHQYGFSSPEELDEALTAVNAEMQDSRSQIKTLESTIREKKELQRHVLDYAATKPTRDGLKAQKSDKARRAYREQHESDFIIADAAKRYFQSHGIEKLPSSKKLQAEINSLTAEKNGIYNTYREQRERVRELQTVKSNIDHILRREQSQRKKQEIDR